jgi:hypothetical protein
MRTSNWTPSIVPRDDDRDDYLVEVDLIHWGRVWTEADSNATDLETVLSDLLAGQHRNPVRIVAFNASEGWSRDASEDVAQELRRRLDLDRRDAPEGLERFLERHEGTRQLTLRLA